MKKLLVLLFLVFGSTALLAEDYKEGTHYQALTPQATDSGDKIEVLEFFWYGCPHCYSFEPYVQSWKKSMPANVVFKRVPAMFRPEWEIQARAYYALSNMNVIEDVHGKIFKAINKDKKRLNTLDQIADFVAKNGVDKQRFKNEYNSFVVDGMVRKAKKKQKAYKIQGVPAIAVNGKYTTGGSMAGSYDNLIKVMDYLIQKESK